MSAHRAAAVKPSDAQQGPPTPSSMSTSPTDPSKKRPRDENTETGTNDDRRQKRSATVSAVQPSAQSSSRDRDSGRTTHGKSLESKIGSTERRTSARRTRRNDTEEDTHGDPTAHHGDTTRSIQSHQPSHEQQERGEGSVSAETMDEDPAEAEANPEDVVEQDQDAVAAHPPSEGDDEEINKGAVPDYVRQEIEEFEKGFNGLQGRFKLLDKIGEGTFSSVYKAIDLEHDLYDNSDWDYDMDAPAESSTSNTELAPAKPANADGGKVVAIKRIYVTSSPVRIQNEIAILHDLSGHKNVVPLITAFRFKDQVIVVLPYFEHHDFRDYYEDLPMDDIRCYFRALLKALAHVHSHKIIHRDIKPSNFLFDLRRKTGLLVDFGLAERQESHPVKPRHASAASRNTSLNGRAPLKGSSSSSAELKLRSIQQNKENSVPATLSGGTSVAAQMPGHGSGATLQTTAAHSTPASRDFIQRTTAAIPVAAVNATSISPVQGRSNVAHSATAPRPTPGMGPASSLASRAQMSLPNTNRVAIASHDGSSNQPRPKPNISSQDRSIVASNIHGIAPADSHVPSLAPSAPVAQSSNSLNYVRPSKPTGSAVIPHPSLVGAREPGFPKKDLRPAIRVNRAGTRGFRAPEILFRHYRQTVAIDIWAVGVTMFSFLSGRFPFSTRMTMLELFLRSLFSLDIVI
ncbi:unnamed protein product [Mortierella alpina]